MGLYRPQRESRRQSRSPCTVSCRFIGLIQVSDLYRYLRNFRAVAAASFAAASSPRSRSILSFRSSCTTTSPFRRPYFRPYPHNDLIRTVPCFSRSHGCTHHPCASPCPQNSMKAWSIYHASATHAHAESTRGFHWWTHIFLLDCVCLPTCISEVLRLCPHGFSMPPPDAGQCSLLPA